MPHWIGFNWLIDCLQAESRATFLWLVVFKNCTLAAIYQVCFFINKIDVLCSVSIFYVCGSGQFLLFLVVHLVGFSQTAWNEFLSHKSHVHGGTGDNGSGHKHLVSSCHDNIFNLTFSSSPNWVWPWWELALNNARSESRNYFHCWRC